jgi:hypothetical protein
VDVAEPSSYFVVEIYSKSLGKLLNLRGAFWGKINRVIIAIPGLGVFNLYLLNPFYLHWGRLKTEKTRQAYTQEEGQAEAEAPCPVLRRIQDEYEEWGQAAGG